MNHFSFKHKVFSQGGSLLLLMNKEHLDEEREVEIEERQKFNERQLDKYGHYKL